MNCAQPSASHAHPPTPAHPAQIHTPSIAALALAEISTESIYLPRSAKGVLIPTAITAKTIIPDVHFAIWNLDSIRLANVSNVRF